MKTIFTIFILVIFISCRDNIPKENIDIPNYSSTLFLADKTVCENNLSSSGQLLSKKEITYFYQFDAINGERIFDSVVSYRYYEYDKDNNLIQELEFDRPKSKKLKPRYEILRTYKDKILQSEHEYDDGILIRYRIHLFDNDNKEIKRTIFHRIPPDDFNMTDIASKNRWSFDTIVCINKYNASGKLIQAENYTSDNNLKSLIEYTYKDGKLNRLVEKTKNGDTLSVTLLDKYDNFDLRVADLYELNCIDSSWTKNERIYKMINYQRDKKQLTQTIYQYDKFGHETESTTKKNYR